MIILFLFIYVCLYIAFVEVRIFTKHPFNTVKYAFIDLYRYIHDRQRNIYDGGKLNCYCAHFGGGKTLSGVEYITYLYKRYNNRRVYDRRKKRWVTQVVMVLSNVDIKNVSCIPLVSLSQIVSVARHNADIDEFEGTRTITLVLIDEASSELNSRSFKDNFNPEVINTLLCCRHYLASIFYTSQKFALTDKLLRSVTQNVIWCSKRWRFMVQYMYDADEMEYCTNPDLLKPFKRFGFLVTDDLYNAYDTLACVDTLIKKFEEGDIMSEEQILASRGDITANLDMVTPSRKLRKRFKRK